MPTDFYVLSYQPNVVLGLITIAICGLTASILGRLFRAEKNNSDSRQVSLDGLRGFLAVGVFLYHYVGTFYLVTTGELHTHNSRFYLFLGSICVALFFMITGFLFWQKLIKNEGKVNWKSLYVSRLFRIMPLYWFTVGVVVLIVFLAGPHQLIVPLRNFLKQIVDWTTFAAYPNINRYNQTYGIVAGVFWTLRYEWLFYFSLPLLAFFVFIRKKFPFLVWILGAGIIWLSYKPIGIEFLQVTTKYFIYFLVGAVAASLNEIQVARKIAVHPVISVIAFMSLVGSFTLFDSLYQFSQVFFLATFFIPVALGNTIFGVLSLKGFTLLGDMSYSIYLLHGIPLHVLYILLFPLAFNAQTDVFMFYLQMFGNGVLIVVISWLTFTFVEKPFIKLGKKISSFNYFKTVPVEGVPEKA